MKGSPKTVDEYIASAPKEAQARLSELRAIVKSAASEADEVISYRMPYYKYHGALVGFAAFKNHIGFFGALSAEDKKEFKDYKIGRGTIQFPFDKPLPAASIGKLIKARKKNTMRRKATRKSIECARLSHGPGTRATSC